jgi:hypothetical protein
MTETGNGKPATASWKAEAGSGKQEAGSWKLEAADKTRVID